MSVYDNMERAVLVVPCSRELDFFFWKKTYGAVHTQFLFYFFFFNLCFQS